jgi:hypothetical protein
MRWDELFEDLEGQLEEAAAAELADEVADRTRRAVAEVGLGDRLRAARGQRLRLETLGAAPVNGVLLEVGTDWLLLHDDAGRDVLVVLGAVLTVAGLAREHVGETSAVRRRLTLGSALRGIAHDRAAVTVRLRDGTAVTGTVDRVGRDFLELAEHPVGEPRRVGQVSGVRALAFAGLATVTRVA